MLAPLQFLHLAHDGWYLRVEHSTPTFIADGMGRLEIAGKTWLKKGETIRVCGTICAFHHPKIGALEVVPFDRFGYRLDPKTGLLVIDHTRQNLRYASLEAFCLNEKARAIARSTIGETKEKKKIESCFVF